VSSAAMATETARRETAWPRIGAFAHGFPRGSLVAMLEQFKEYGLSAVQLSRDLLDEAMESPAATAHTRRAFAERGMTIAAIAGYRNLLAPDAEKRRAGIAFVARCLEAAPLLGTSIVATETGTRHPDDDWTAVPENDRPESWGMLRAALDTLVPVAERHGSVLAMEGFVNNVLRTPDQLAALLDEYRTPHMQVVLDPFNYLSRALLPDQEAVVADYLRRFKDRFVVAHLKDVSPDGAEIATPEFGAGVFSYRQYFAFLRSERPDLPIILEHLPIEHIAAAVERFHALNAADQ
jgi:sugar phosphate isomerase/epimerase